MEKLSRVKRYEELRNSIANDNEANSTTPVLNNYQEKLNNIINNSENASVSINQTQAVIEEKNEYVEPPIEEKGEYNEPAVEPIIEEPVINDEQDDFLSLLDDVDSKDFDFNISSYDPPERDNQLSVDDLLNNFDDLDSFDNIDLSASESLNEEESIQKEKVQEESKQDNIEHIFEEIVDNKEPVSQDDPLIEEPISITINEEEKKEEPVYENSFEIIDFITSSSDRNEASLNQEPVKEEEIKEEIIQEPVKEEEIKEEINQESVNEEENKEDFVKEEVSEVIDDDHDFINQAIKEANNYNLQEGRTTLDNISENLIDEVRNNVSEINPVIEEEIKEKEQNESFDLEDIFNDNKEEVNIEEVKYNEEKPYIAVPLAEEAIEEEEKPSFQSPTKEGIDIPTLTELQVKDENLLGGTTIPFAIENKTELELDEEDEELDTPSKILNVLLTILVIALIAVLGFVVFELFKAGIIKFN